MPIEIKPLRRRDVDTFVTFLFEGFSDQLPERGTDPRQFARLLRVVLSVWGLPLWLARGLSRHEALAVLAWDGSQAVGCLTALGPRACPSLTGVYVRPSHRDRKVGLDLVENVLSRLVARGCTQAHVSAPTAGGEALARSAGFAPHDRVSLYRLRLPAAIPPQPEITLRRIPLREVSPWEIVERAPRNRAVARLLGVRSFALRAEGAGGPVLRASLYALAGEVAPEVRVEVLHRPAEDALLAILAKAAEWASRLGMREVSLFLPDDEEALVHCVEGMGLLKARSWARLCIDLTRDERGPLTPPDVLGGRGHATPCAGAGPRGPRGLRRPPVP